MIHIFNRIPTESTSFLFDIYICLMGKAPTCVLKALERMRRDFLWGGDEGKQKMTWVAWKKTVASKEGGGLGFGLLRDVNIAMLAKWW
uniref:Reverse transcriptase domain, Reverse transcriptase zinc-binding domain protein n=1 Tax=Helianthus annuus TaxID=4232 RepID=A0A251TZC7_HELAN